MIFGNDSSTMLSRLTWATSAPGIHARTERDDHLFHRDQIQFASKRFSILQQLFHQDCEASNLVAQYVCVAQVFRAIAESRFKCIEYRRDPEQRISDFVRYAGHQRSEQRHHLALAQRSFELGAFGDVLRDQNRSFADGTEFADVIERDGPGFSGHLIFDLFCDRSRGCRECSRLIPQPFSMADVSPSVANNSADNLFRPDADNLLGGEIRALDRASEIDDQHRKIDRVESLPPLHRGLLDRRVQPLLFLVEKSFVP